MRNAVIAAVVAAVVAAASGTAATIVVTSKNIKNGTIQTVDISAKAKRALKGNRASARLRGAPGVDGAPGLAGIARLIYVDGPVDNQCSLLLTCPPEESPVGFSVATCPADSYVVGGGFTTEHIENWITDVHVGNKSYAVTAVNYWDGNPTSSIQAKAICASGPGITASASGAAGAANLRQRVAEVREAVASTAPGESRDGQSPPGGD